MTKPPLDGVFRLVNFASSATAAAAARTKGMYIIGLNEVIRFTAIVIFTKESAAYASGIKLLLRGGINNDPCKKKNNKGKNKGGVKGKKLVKHVLDGNEIKF